MDFSQIFGGGGGGAATGGPSSSAQASNTFGATTGLSENVVALIGIAIVAVIAGIGIFLATRK